MRRGKEIWGNFWNKFTERSWYNIVTQCTNEHDVTVTGIRTLVIDITFF